MTAFSDTISPGSGAAFGTWVKLPTPESVELLALAGFDFVVLDMEHAPLDVPTVHRLLGVGRALGLPTLVRVPDRGASTISRVLDSGASGVLVPHVDTVADATAMVAAARFPPVGARGYGPTVRAGAWGADVPGYRAAAAKAVVVPQLESEAAVTAAAEIGAVHGLDAIFVGPADLAVATGLDPGSAALDALLRSADDAAARAGVPIGTAVGDLAAARRVAGRYDFVLVAGDAALLGRAAADLLCACREQAPVTD